MELLLSVIHGHGLLAAFIFLLVNLSPSSSLSQVVGGGTAGCPLAATLSEKFSVLLIERGGSPYENPTLLDKKYFGFPFLQTDEFSSVAQRFISEDGVPNLRGRVLGGTSTINAGFYSRASADFIKRVGWDEKLVKEAYEWVESKIVFKPLLTKWSSAVMSALLEAGILPFNGFSWNHIAGTKIGGTVFDADRKRHISADLLERGNSSNILVLLNATVKNIVFQRDEQRQHKSNLTKLTLANQRIRVNMAMSPRQSPDSIAKRHRAKSTSGELQHPTFAGLERGGARYARQSWNSLDPSGPNLNIAYQNRLKLLA
uniref:Uncharacterized protein n=1 Tax=Salix viminalis TaxID=40686 RepID=A0A6N2NCD5_SALVM